MFKPLKAEAKGFQKIAYNNSIQLRSSSKKIGTSNGGSNYTDGSFVELIMLFT
jgi:hypothetical protein